MATIMEYVDLKIMKDMNNHTGQYLKTETGKVAHVLADPNMSPETQTMLEKLIEVAYEKIDERIPCHQCQGGGCPNCNGFGYYYNS